MNPKTRQRAIRSFFASLLQGDFSEREMYELADELSLGTFAKELSDLLREWTRISDVGRPREVDRPYYYEESSRPASFLNIAMDTISRRRLPKKMVIQIMSLASPWIKQSQLPSSATIREIIEKYMLIASPTEMAKFLNILEGEPTDAYIKGISRRDRAK